MKIAYMYNIAWRQIQRQIQIPKAPMQCEVVVPFRELSLGWPRVTPEDWGMYVICGSSICEIIQVCFAYSVQCSNKRVYAN